MSQNPANSRKSDAKKGPVENWDRIVHKNVRTSDNQGFGKVVAIPDDRDAILISSQSGSDQYMLPRSEVSGFNGAEIILGITAAQLASYKVEEASASEAHPSDLVTENEMTTSPREDTVQLVEERLNVKKRTKTEHATIRKEPVKETKTLEVPITYDELVLERRPASGKAAQPPAESAEELRISLNREEFEVVKEPYVKEELVIRKEPKTDIKTITETVSSERVSSTDLPSGQGSKP
jgi:uncharacterized protein (TIGR02271 family)